VIVLVTTALGFLAAYTVYRKMRNELAFFVS
jgi:hypothetical protein